jgi:hypothetical protein
VLVKWNAQTYLIVAPPQKTADFLQATSARAYCTGADSGGQGEDGRADGVGKRGVDAIGGVAISR